MKKCKKCGAIQSDERTVCIDCGTILDAPLSEAEAKAEEEALSGSLGDMADRTEDFYVSPLSRALGIAAVVGLCASIVLLNLAGVFRSRLVRQYPALDAGPFLSAGEPLSSSVLQRYNDLNTGAAFALVGIPCFFLAALALLFPKAVWFLDTLRLRAMVRSDALEPSFFYISVVRVIKYLLFSGGVFTLAMAIWHLV